MIQHDRDIASCKALVIDANPTSRSILASMLHEMGIKSVIQTGKVPDARRQLENRVFDVVLCDYHFERGDYTGQDLLDDLRRAQLLPFSTVFIMVTGECSYAKVAEAAESALDGYLLKPHNAATLADRVNQARQRKFTLRDIFEPIEAEKLELAAERCQARFASRGRYWLYAARIGAELLLRLGRHDDARALFEAVNEIKPLAWSRLGVARAQAESGRMPQASRTLESLLGDEPTYTDALDVMARVQLEQGLLEEALATSRRASTLTPHSIARLQKQGMLAFTLGRVDEAAKTLERAMSIGLGSKMFDHRSALLLALACFDRRDGKGMLRHRADIAHAVEKTPHSDRMRRFLAIVDLFRDLTHLQPADVTRAIDAMTAEIRDPTFDFEAACNLVSTLARLRSADVAAADDDTWITQLAKRFCVSKASTELLAAASSKWPRYAEILRAEHLEINATAERAMAFTLEGNPGATVAALLESGGLTLNAKLLDVARLSVQRHHARIADAGELAARIGELRNRFCAGGIQVQFGGSAGRQSGGLALRAAVPDAPAAAHHHHDDALLASVD